jgi:large subunit ribosomal protein L21
MAKATETKASKTKTAKTAATTPKVVVSRTTPRADVTGPLAVIATGGKQYVVHKGTTVDVELIPNSKDGDSVEFDTLLIDPNTESGSALVGAPFVTKKVTGKIIETGRHAKVTVIRYRQKSRYFKKNGHRQPFMTVEITNIPA